MKFKGFDVEINKKIGFRKANKDRDLQGNILSEDYIAFIRMKDAKLYYDVISKERVYNPTHAPAIPLNYGGSFYGISNFVKKNVTIEIPDVRGINTLVNKYWEATIYVAMADKEGKGEVFTGKIRRINMPNTSKDFQPIVQKAWELRKAKK